jgi:REP element-mobilizing transposase RayT
MSILSLQPSESISSCASKLKGQLSKCLRENLQLTQKQNLLSKGYFAITVGKSTAQSVARYLDKQAQHHGYDKRILPPVFVGRYDSKQSDEILLAAAHAAVVSRFHIVLSTHGRWGVLGAHQGEAIAAQWLGLQEQCRIRLLKVSFVPDHVHIALRAHPSVAPLKIICELMNSAQETVSHEMVRAGIDRLWLPSAYVGSYGDLADAEVRKYVENWRNKDKLP